MACYELEARRLEGMHAMAAKAVLLPALPFRLCGGRGQEPNIRTTRSACRGVCLAM